MHRARVHGRGYGSPARVRRRDPSSFAARSVSMRGSHSGCPARLANPQAADRAIAKSTGAPLRWSRRVPDVNNRRDAAAPRPRMDTLDLDINMRVNGEDVQARIAPRKTLVDFLRDDLCLTGTHVGCEHGVCGACAVRLDGEVVRGCLVFAVQCGYCTPGMLIGAQELLAAGGVPSRDTIREHLSGNYCRCTGYQAIVDAIESVAQMRAGKASRQ